MDHTPHGLVEAALAFLASMLPPALGATVSLAYEQGLTWAARFTQLWVGIVVGYFGTGAVASCWPWGDLDAFVRQAIGFVVGLVAFKATPRFMGSIVEIVADLPARVAEMVPFLRRKGGGGGAA